VDYFGEHKHGRDNMSLKDLSIIKKGSLILKPGQRSDISRA